MGTRHTGKAAETRALATFVKLMRATNTVRHRLERQLAAHGLTPTQFGILEALLHVGPLNQRNLGRKLLLSKGNITIVVNHLERRGLVRRVAHSADRRQSVVHLTRPGRSFIRTFFPSHAAAIAHELAVLTAAEQEQLGQLCRKLGLGSRNLRV
ncbi:MAG: MarR family winged helix-turn-helix transcriptional regulator [Gemmatimonadales bacterium]